MALSIDWATKVITVPKADLTLIQSVPTEIRSLSIPAFHAELRDIEDSETGMVFPDTHNYVGPIDVGGVALAPVISIINGYTVTFEDGMYAVNLVGANSNIGDNVNVNSVSVRSANSAGLTYSKEVEDQSFTDSRIAVNTVSGISTTNFPAGTPGVPVIGLTEAGQIALARTLPKRMALSGNLVLGGGDSIADWNVEGGTLTLTGTDVEGLSGGNFIITGSGVGAMSVSNHVVFDNYSGFQGDAEEAELVGTMTLADYAGDYQFYDCFSGVPGTGTPVIDCNNIVGLQLALRPYTGGIELRNITDAGSSISVDLISGRVVIASSCTAGTIVIRGTGWVTDNSSGMTVVTTGLTTDPAAVVTPASIWDYPQASITETSSVGYYLMKKVLTAAKFLGLK